VSRTFARILPLWLVLFSFVTSNSMITPYLGLYVLSLGATTLLVGAAYATNSVVSFLGRLPASSLADRYGNRLFIILGFASNLIGMALYALVPDANVVLLARALQGVALALFHPSVLSYLVRLGIAERKSTEVVSYTSTGAALGQSLGPALGAALLVTGSFFNVFVSSLAICALGTALALGSVKDERPHSSGMNQNASLLVRSKAMLNRQFSLTLYSRAAVSYVSGMVTVIIPLLATQELKFSQSGVGLLFTIAAVFNLVARPFSGKLSSRIKEDRVLEMGIILSALAATLYLASFSPIVLWIAMMVYGLGLGIFIPSSILNVDRTVSSESLTLGMGVMTMMIDLGMATGSAISILLLSSQGYNGAFVIAALVGFSGLFTQRLSRLVTSP